MNIQNENGVAPEQKKQHKLLFSILFVLIAAVSVWAVVGQSKDFSLSGFIAYISSSMNPYLVMAFVCVFLFILFEGLALLRICRGFGYKRGVGKGFVYSAADIYFSAITPSATGGQPASAFFMMKDSIPGSVVTVSLIINLIMYILSSLIFGLLGLGFGFDILSALSPISKILIGVGIITQIFLIVLFILVLKKDQILYVSGCGIIKLMKMLHLTRKPSSKRKKLRKTLDSYKEVVEKIKGKRRMLLEAFILNILQRASLIAVFVFAFLATGGDAANWTDIFCVESMAILGSNTIPIPGAMGVMDYLLLDGMGLFMTESAAINLELLSRSISFYLCVFSCGITILVRYIQISFKRMGKKL